MESGSPLKNIKTAFDFGRSQEKIIFQKLKRLFKKTQIDIEYTNQKGDKRLPYDLKIIKDNKIITVDIETTPLISEWHKRWVEKGTCEEILNRGLRMPLRKFNKQIGENHLYLKMSPNRKCFFCFIFPEINQHLIDGIQDRKNSVSHVKPNNNEFKVISWSNINSLTHCVIIDDFEKLKNKIIEILKK